MKNLLKKIFNKETILYIVFGILTTAVNFAAQFVFEKLLTRGEVADSSEYNIKFQIATAIAWIIAVLFAYVTNKIWVFESKSWKAKIVIREILSFFGARLLAFLLFDELIQTLVLSLVNKGVTDAQVMQRNAWIVKVIVCVFVVIFNYFASKFFIFKKKKNKENPDEQNTGNTTTKEN